MIKMVTIQITIDDDKLERIVNAFDTVYNEDELNVIGDVEKVIFMALVRTEEIEEIIAEM
jgi:hypothetical protein